jgi:hypothetical protein
MICLTETWQHPEEKNIMPVGALVVHGGYAVGAERRTEACFITG